MTEERKKERKQKEESESNGKTEPIYLIC